MLAAVRNVAWGAAMAMTAFLAVMLAGNLWLILSFPSDARSIFLGPPALFDGDWQITSQYAEALLGLAVAIWLIALAARRASRSISAYLQSRH